MGAYTRLHFKDTTNVLRSGSHDEPMVSPTAARILTPGCGAAKLAPGSAAVDPFGSVRMPVHLPGRQLSDKLTALYVEASAMPPGADVTIEFGTLADLEGTAGGRHEWDTRAGPSWIKIAPEAGDYVLAHELLHVVFLRRGHPAVVPRRSAPEEVSELANLISDAVVHPMLWHELRGRGFDDSSHWESQLAGLECSDAETLLSEHTGTLADALALTDLLTGGGVDASAVAAMTRTHSPETTRLAERFAAIVGIQRGSTQSDREMVMKELIEAIDSELGAAGAPVETRLQPHLTAM